MTVCFLNGINTEKIERIIGKKIVYRAFVRGGWGHYVYAYAIGDADNYYRVDAKNKTYEIKPVVIRDGYKIYIGFNPESQKQDE